MKFDKFANTYSKYNFIQKKIIKSYLPFIKKRVVDLGCGSEGLCKYKKFDFYLGVDKSKEMLNLNPCNVINMDFDKKECFEKIKEYNFNQIVSFSALQWSKNLEFVFKEIKKLNKSFLLAIFTSNTFKNLHTCLDIKSPIYSREEILSYSSIFSSLNIDIIYYEMEFNNAKEMLNYIKFSGVSGNTNTKISKIRNLLKCNFLNKLEFEIVVLRYDII